MQLVSHYLSISIIIIISRNIRICQHYVWNVTTDKNKWQWKSHVYDIYYKMVEVLKEKGIKLTSY